MIAFVKHALTNQDALYGEARKCGRLARPGTITSFAYRKVNITAHVLGGSSCMVKNEGKGRKMTGFQRHKKPVVLMDISKPSQTSMGKKYFYKNDASHGRDREKYCFVTNLCARPRAKTFICVR